MRRIWFLLSLGSLALGFAVGREMPRRWSLRSNSAEAGAPKPVVIALAKAESRKPPEGPSSSELAALAREKLAALRVGDDVTAAVMALRELVRVDATKALALIRESEFPQRAKVFAGLMKRVFEHDYLELRSGLFNEVLATFECDPSIARDRDAVERAFAYLAHEDFVAAWKQAFETERPFCMSAARGMTSGFDKLSDRQALDFLGAQPDSAQKLFLMNWAAQRWATSDLASFITWAHANPPSSARLSNEWLRRALPRSAQDLVDLHDIIGSVFTGETAGRLVDVLEDEGINSAPYLRALPPGPLRDHGLVTHYLRGSAIDPVSARRLLADLQSMEARRQLTSGIAEVLARKDIAAAFAFIATLDETSQLMARRTIGESMSGERADAAAAYYSAHPEHLDTSVLDSLSGDAWDRHAPRVAQAALRLKDNFARQQVLRSAMESWFNIDSVAATRWVASLPASPASDDAAAALAEATSDPATEPPPVNQIPLRIGLVPMNSDPALRLYGENNFFPRPE